jgi:Fe-S-cluster-containing dehydrogenase component
MVDKPRSSEDLFGRDWETRAREKLAFVGENAALGTAAARDAIRVVAGELTEEEFHERHHEAYLSEFGVDERPLRIAGTGPQTASTQTGTAQTAVLKANVRDADTMPVASPSRSLPLSRRDVLRLAGAGTAALVLGELLRSEASGAGVVGEPPEPLVPANGEEPEHQQSVRWGMVIDLESCTGCLACVDGCHEENGLSDGVHWIYSQAFVDENREDVNFLVRPCQHCSNAPCVKVCPVAARHVRDADGLVLTDYDLCIGCRYCEVACPYGVNYFQWGDPSEYGGGFEGERRDVHGRSVIGSPPRGVIGKCTFCPQRVDDEASRGTAACVLACPHDSLHIGDLNDPESEPRRYLTRRLEENPNLSTFRLLDELGTEPNVIYIGQEPTERAEPAEAPITYEDWGFVDDRRAVLEGPEPWFIRTVGAGNGQ